MKKWYPKICFFDSWKWSEKSIYSWKMVVLCIFKNFKKYSIKKRSNYVPKHDYKTTLDFSTPENGHKSHFSTQISLFFGVLTHLQNSLPYIFWWNFLLPIKIGCEDYGRKKFHEEMVSENMFFWLVKVVWKINIFVENGSSLHFQEFQKMPLFY